MGEEPAQVRREIEATRGRMTDTIGAIEDRMSPSQVMHRRRLATRRRLTGMREAVMGHAPDMGERTGSVRERASGKASELSDTVSDLPHAAGRRTEGNPLAAGLIAFGAGLLAASLLPKTKEEQQLAHRVEPQLAETAEEVKAAGQLTAESAKQEAKEHAGDMKQQASGAAQSVSEEAKSRAGDVGEQARQQTRQAREEMP